jgi:hypothetical protein
MSSLANAAEISAGVSAVVTAVVGTMINWGGQIVSYLRRVLPADHHALNSGQTALNNIGARRLGVPVLVAAAPIRMCRSKEVDPDVAIAFVHDVVADECGHEPEFSSPLYGVRFAKAAPGLGASETSRQFCANRGGRIDLSWSIEVEPDENEADTAPIPLEDIARPLLMVLGALRMRRYHEVFKLPIRNRHRFDWYFGICTSLTDGNGSQLFWRVQFPGREATRIKKQRPFSPSGGFADQELRGWDINRPWEDLVSIALTGFLKHNGYHNCQDAVADTVEVIRQRIIPDIAALAHPSGRLQLHS